MDRDTTFKDHHLWELQRRDSLNNSLSLPVGVLTIVTGGALTMAKSIETECTVTSIGLIVTLIITAALLICSLYCLVKSLISYKYSHAPDMVVWLNDRDQYEKEYRDKWQDASSAKSEDEAASIARNEFYYHLDKTYAKSARDNNIQNNRKAEWIARGHRLLIASLSTLMLAGLFFSLSPTKTANYASSKSTKEASTMTISSKSKNPVNSPAPPPAATKPKEIQRPPFREPIVSNENFPVKD